MASEIFEDDVIFYQRLLKSLGFYDDDLDGLWGPNTAAGDAKFVSETTAIAAELGTFDSRTERNVTTLHSKAQRAARKAMKAVADAGFPLTVRIISGTRTYAEQDRLFAKGRFGDRGPVVTKARGGQSNHNFAIAWDIAVFDGDEYLDGNTGEEVDKYRQVADIVGNDGLTWGGTWASFPDIAHFQLNNGMDSSGTRQKFERGEAYV